ncbi:hypothetical protein [Bacillus amyloliquefaciens]|uniref:hypothetical protein n=1 Tax=Bacillus amyloliquefaciens TaxID=1390 RepID=UPI000C8392ED|nr:hypothetical protein [Bacillus amyloliquefaciens]
MANDLQRAWVRAEEAAKEAERFLEEQRKEAERVLEEKRREAERAAAEAQRIADEAAREAAKIAEEKLREAERATAEAQRIAEEAAKEAARIAEEAKKAAKGELIAAIKDTIDKLKEEIPDPSEQAKQMIDEIETYKEQLESLLEELNPVVLINKALDKAELICEEYINSKMVPIFSPIQLKGLSDAEFSLNGTQINAGLTLYLVLGDFEGDFRKDFIKNITVNVEIDLADLRLPDPLPTPVINDGNFNVEDEIKRRLEEERDRIIEELVIVIVDSYMPVFIVIDKFKDLLKI